MLETPAKTFQRKWPKRQNNSPKQVNLKLSRFLTGFVRLAMGGSRLPVGPVRIVVPPSQLAITQSAVWLSSFGGPSRFAPKGLDFPLFSLFNLDHMPRQFLATVATLIEQLVHLQPLVLLFEA